MRWFVASAAALLVLALTYPVIAVGSSEGPGRCSSIVGLRTLGTSESCDTVGLGVSVVGAALVFLVVLQVGKVSRARWRSRGRAGSRARG